MKEKQTDGYIRRLDLNQDFLVERNDMRITIREAAKAIGVAYSTVAAYAQKAGWTENGKLTLLTKEQVTVILEAMKIPKASGRKNNLLFQTEGISTTKSRALRIDLLHRQIEAEMQSEINELRNNLAITHQLLEYRTSGLEMIQRIAEAGGLINSDRDDIADTYQRSR
jgi:hypothetical protein